MCRPLPQVDTSILVPKLVTVAVVLLREAGIQTVPSWLRFNGTRMEKNADEVNLLREIYH